MSEEPATPSIDEAAGYDTVDQAAVPEAESEPVVVLEDYGLHLP